MSAEFIFNLLAQMDQLGGSDLYLTVGRAPSLRLDNRIQDLRAAPIVPGEIAAMLEAVLTPRQKKSFEETMEFNGSLDLGKHGRFRINALRQRQHPALVIRRIVSNIPTFEQLKLPPIMGHLALQKWGLILITGMTGSGKSTTLASMVDYRNQREAGHIVTIEDPIEFFHDHKKSIVTQREVGVDTDSYTIAMKNVLRQRPDVILVGEIRDRETMEQALLVSETGHLCMSTLHTNNTYQAIERIINFFPEDQAPQIRLSLGLNLRAIISQRLVPDKSGGLVLAPEIMLNEGLVRELILEGKITKIREVMEQNLAHGMMTFDTALYTLFTGGQISEETALAYADVAADMRLRLKQKKAAGTDKVDFRNMDTAGLSLTDPEETRAAPKR